MSSDQREFPIAVLLSLTSGILLCNFSILHEAAEYIVGTPIYTHQFASSELNENLRNIVLSQHPEISAVDYSGGINTENWKEFLDKAEVVLGKSLVMEPRPLSEG